MTLAAFSRADYLLAMTVLKALAVAVTALCAAGPFDAAVAQRYQGIMTEEGRPAPKNHVNKKPVKKQDMDAPGAEQQAVEKPPPKKRPRGSSTYIPPPVPSPHGRDPVVQPTVPVYRPPRIETFSDRVTRCNHSFPLNAGIGNNPTDRDAYVRQCAN